MSVALSYAAGVTLPGGYVLERVVDKGAFAVVYAGLDPDGERVAIKLLASDHPQARQRFLREIKITRDLPRGDHVVAYRGHGETEDGIPFLAMEFIDGHTLGRMLRAGRRLAEPAACEFMLQLCDAMAGLHKLGLTHGDIKPENIMLLKQGLVVKLIDFGLVRDAQALLRTLEEHDFIPGHEFCDDLDTGMLAGTPDYIAPEQIADARVTDSRKIRTDTPSDVFGLGVILYQLLTGERPWPFEPDAADGLQYKRQVRDYLDSRLEVDAADLECPERISPALWTIIAKTLRRDPKRRQGDARELRADIQRYVASGAGVIGDTQMEVTLPTYLGSLLEGWDEEGVEAAPEPMPVTVFADPRAKPARTTDSAAPQRNGSSSAEPAPKQPEPDATAQAEPSTREALTSTAILLGLVLLVLILAGGV